MANGMMGLDIQNGTGMAVNPRTGKLEQVYATYSSGGDPGSAGTMQESGYYFPSDGPLPQGAMSLAGYAPGYYSHDWGSTFDNFMGNYAVPLGLAAIGGAGAYTALGGEAAAGGAAGYGGAGDYAAANGGSVLAGGAGGTGAAGAGGYDLGGGLSVDEYGNVTGGLFEGGPGTPGAGDFFNPGASESALNWGSIGNAASRLFGGGGGGTGGGGGGVTDFLGGLLPNNPSSLIPGAMALTYAGMQPGLDMGNLNAVLGSVSGNRNAVVQAATDPFQQNIAAGYGDLLQSQGLRGIRGSSFGNTDIANYLATTGRGLANAGASAAQGSLALQGNLAAQIAQLTNQSQQLKNSLYGTAFDVLGRGLNPKGYAGSINIGGGTGATSPTAGGGGGGFNIANLAGSLGGLFNSNPGLLSKLFSGGGGGSSSAPIVGDAIDLASYA